KQVLLVDADLRRPRASAFMGVGNNHGRPGLAEVLRAEAELGEAIWSSSKHDLHFLSAGQIPRNPAELLSSPRLQEVLKAAVEMFDWVIIDSPPIQPLADVSLLAPYCDAVLLVVQARRTSAAIVQQSIERIGREKICGVIMNRVKGQSSRY